MKPDMVKAMEYAKRHADKFMPLSASSSQAEQNYADLTDMCRVFLALSAEHEALVKRVESIKELRGYEFRIEWLPNPLTGDGEAKSVEYIRRSELLARLTEKAKP